MPATIIRNSDIINVLAPDLVEDEYNSIVEDWSTPTIVATGRASIQNYLATEDDVDRQTETEGFRLITDDPALFNYIDARYRIDYNGVILEVTSPEQKWRLFARPHHVEVFLRRVDG